MLLETLVNPIVVAYQMQLTIQKSHYDFLLAKDKVRIDQLEAKNKFLEEQVKYLQRTK